MEARQIYQRIMNDIQTRIVQSKQLFPGEAVEALENIRDYADEGVMVIGEDIQAAANKEGETDG